MRRILVTGANKGIGLAIVQRILSEHSDTFVYLASRDLERGKAATERIEKGSDRVEVIALDVASDSSVAEAVRSIEKQKPLYGVVNNAGIGQGNTLAAMLNTNALGVRRVCEAFLPLLDPNGGRIVNVTSAAGPNFVATCSAERQRFFLDDKVTWPQLQAVIDESLALGDNNKEGFAAKGLGDGSPYGLSKACANLYTLLLARANPKLHINACTPGFIETDMTRSYAQAQNKTPAEVGMKTPFEGALSTIHLLFSDALEGNGRYYGSDAKRSPLDRYRAPGSPEFTG
jgi:NAD(P)-dependent dehydrogenase (short-subunit alcohol dehydrogenase family)